LHASVFRTAARADSAAAHSHPSDAPAPAPFGALSAGPQSASQNQPPTARNLARGHGLGAVAVFIGAQNEVVAIDGNFLGIPRLHFHLGHDVVSTQIVAESFLHRRSVEVDGDVEDHV